MAVIKTQREYEQARQTLEQWRVSGETLRTSIKAAGLSPEQVEQAMAPHLAMQDQIEGELRWFERARGGEIRPVARLTDVGLSLIALRIARGLTQRQLAERLGVNEAQISKDERNAYHGISVERAQRIVDALGGTVSLAVTAQEEGSEPAEPVPAR